MDAAQRRELDRQLKRELDADVARRVYGGDYMTYRAGPEYRPQTTTTLPQDSAERKKVPLYSGPLRLFPAALAEVAKVIQVGNDKHCPGSELVHVRWKSTDHADCIVRHLVDLSENYGQGRGYDENGVPQVAYIAWRALALCQEWCEQNLGSPPAPAARFEVTVDEQDPPVVVPTNTPGAGELFSGTPGAYSLAVHRDLGDTYPDATVPVGEPSVVDHE